ncbi:hypothetical protein BJV82DRAFT_614512 [Fennellomyces sp. T-0311]|nr:hypothetical protein BJV82DRAFT_614512 [Fennellomyces sp. T-0311]
MPLLRIPQEILGVIADTLPVEDRFTCISVCKDWSTEFIASFYRIVTLTTERQCALFYDTLLESSLYPNRRVLGRHVREICIAAYEPSTPLLESLPQLCPFVHRVVVTQNGYHSQNFQQFPWSFPILPSITHLSLKPGVTDLGWLCALPRLTWINMHWVGKTWSMGHLAELHTLCPQLETLELTITSSDVTNALDLSQLPCVPNLHRLSLQLSTGIPDAMVALWIDVCAQKYPNLKHVAINTACKYNSRFQFGADSNLAALYETFAISCPHVESIQLDDFVHCDLFLRAMIRHQRHLKSMQVSDMAEFPWESIISATARFKSTITSLAFGCKYHMFPGSSIDSLFRCLGQLPHLTQLFLAEPSSTVPMDALLDTMPALKCLTLTSSWPWLRNTVADGKPKHNLEILNFIQDITDEAVFDYIGQRCPNLRRLKLERTYIKHINDDQKLLRIQLSALKLEKVILHEVSRHSPSASDTFSVIGVQTTHDACQWYDTSKAPLRKGNVPGYVMSAGSIHDANSSKLLIQCTSLQNLYCKDTRLIL